MKEKILGILFVGAIMLALVMGLSLLTAFPFMWLWNYAVVGAITVAKPIEYWVAYWLMTFVSFFLVSRSSS